MIQEVKDAQTTIVGICTINICSISGRCSNNMLFVGMAIAPAFNNVALLE